jgi:DNA-binding CsgD family transcriptional regulator
VTAQPATLFGVEVTAVPNPRKRSSDRLTVSDARHAFFHGEFERCIAVCDTIRPANDATRVEVALLRARALLRLDRPDKAIDAIRGSSFVKLSGDELVTSQMLLGSAYVKLGQPQRGASILDEAIHHARRVHPTISAELTLNLGIAWYVMGEPVKAQELLTSVAQDADIVHVRALEYQGWLALAQSDFPGSAEHFRAALDELDRCDHRDRFVEANILQGLASAYPELLRDDDWPRIQARIQTFDWPANDVARPQFWTMFFTSIMSEIRGDFLEARYWVRRAERASSAIGYRVVAYSRMAALFRAEGEMRAHLDFVLRAHELYSEVSSRELPSDLKQAPLVLAEEMIHAGQYDAARRLLVQYRDVLAPVSREPGTDRVAALESAAEGALLEATGEHQRSIQAYSKAFQTFRRCGLRRQACMVAVRLARITKEPSYVEYARETLAPVPKYWLAHELTALEKDAGPRLSPSQMSVLRLVVEGKTYKEIAALRGGSWRTARNIVHVLFRKFNVKSKGELIALVTRRRLVDL